MLKNYAKKKAGIVFEVLTLSSSVKMKSMKKQVKEKILNIRKYKEKSLEKVEIKAKRLSLKENKGTEKIK